MKPYNHNEIEPQWQKKWQDDNLYHTTENIAVPKCYVLDMFPYPSGEGLHVGHLKGYIATDIYSRYKKMNGACVLHPMGWDAFGLPAENYALKNKVHPRISVDKNIARYKEQLSILGFNYDWDREINTTDPAYYRWTQWIFVQLFKKGLAFESHEPINWCPSCKTGLANEDLDGDRCERCGTIVEKKPLRQWVLKITDYADRLLKDLDMLDWPESIKESQRNWIGRSEGVNLTFKVKDTDISFEMYDSVPQTFMAQTFTVIAPEHARLFDLVKGTEHEKPVMDFVERIKEKKAQGTFDHVKDMEGIFTGRYIEYTPTGKNIPIWVASFVVADYGTGVVNCSAHDERDFVFAKKYNIPLHAVLFPEDVEHAKKVAATEVFYREAEGKLAEPKEFSGRRWDEAREDIIEYIVKKGFGTRKVNYKLRDWVFSRQRYWGEPIPIIHCEKCGPVAVPEKDLPVMLPEVEFYEPSGTGESPLATIPDWVATICPQCGGKGKRETNTMPQWAGSSWYHLRFMDPHNDKALVDPLKEKFWTPVDFYVGGTEHATRHLIYARFWHKFLYDIGAVSTEEPFKKLKNQGLIAGPDGRKMSKRYGNVVNPSDVVAQYGADTLRVYEMFIGPFEQGAAWSVEGIIGPRRFIERIWKFKEKIKEDIPTDPKILNLLHKTIKKVTTDIEIMSFNTAVSQLMILSNEIEKLPALDKKVYEMLLQILAPFAPHMTDEVWHEIGHADSIHISKWPSWDEKLTKDSTLTIVVQVNGKVRSSFEIAADSSEEDITKMALHMPEIAKWTEGKEPRKIIFVKGKLVNIVL